MSLYSLRIKFAEQRARNSRRRRVAPLWFPGVKKTPNVMQGPERRA